MPQFKEPSLADFRAKYKIQSESISQDNYGNQTGVWSDVINPIWGTLIDYVRPAILQAIEHIQPTQLFDITTRYRPGITKDMRIVEISTNRTFRILDINDPNHRHKWLVFRVTEFA